ncbi:hypothetical protein EDB89DRAFT_1974486 [Lactarius sanguifluus]|nr:hypothetical protein EDB89DRAFT_1974486 [Lactarius sanguifluus]
MTSYYIDPERCFEVPFCIPLPDKGIMAARLASIQLIMRDAREGQSQFCAEHRRTLSSQPSQYRYIAKAMMDGGRLKRFVGNLARRYIDYLDFHQESPKKLSPLAIQIPSLCPSLSPPLSYLFGPPRKDDFNSIIKNNLSWSQFAAPAPAGWREQFLYERRWEREVEHRILNEYSDSEREAEYAALESLRRQLRTCLRTGAETPPPLERKRPIPLPLSTPPLSSSNAPPCNESAHIKSEAVADSGLSTVDGKRSAFLASEAQINKGTVRQQLPTEHTGQRLSLSARPSHRRPALQIVIPGSDRHEPWLNGPICSSPLSGVDVSSPSVLLDAHAVREYLDLVHGPHPLLPGPASPRLCYPSPPLPPSPCKLATDNPAEQMSLNYLTHPGARTILPTSFLSVSTKQNSEPRSGALRLLPSTWPGSHIYQPQPIHASKRRASLGIAAFGGTSKRPRLMARA